MMRTFVVSGRKLNKVAIGTFSKSSKSSMGTFSRFKANEMGVAPVIKGNQVVANDPSIYNPSRYSPSSMLFPFTNPFASPFTAPLLDSLLGPSLFPLTSSVPFKINACESAKEFHFAAELPGVKKGDVHIDINKDNILTVQALKRHDHESKHDDKNVHWYHEEHSFGKVKRSFKLPENIKPDDIKASLKDGILSIDIPKSSEDEDHLKKKKLIHID